jgi:ATP-binding cassette subfamily C protein CydD/ATP-binding cassette subfamily C protein CydCD
MRALDPRLLRHARAARAFLGASVGLGVATALLVVVQANLLAYAVSAVFHDGAARRDLGRALAGLAVVVIARAAVVWAQEAAAHRSAAAVRGELREQLLAHAVRLGPAGATRTAELTTLATRGLDALDSYFARYLPQVLLAALVPLAVLVAVFPADVLAGVTIAVTLPLIPVFMGLVGRATEVHSRQQFAQLGRLTHHLLEVIQGLPTLKAFGRARSQAAVVSSLSAEQRRLGMRTLRLAFLSSLVLELLATVSVALVAVGIGLRLVGGSLELRTALLVLILAPEAYAPLRQLGAHYHASAEGLAAVESVFATLDAPVSTRGTALPPEGPLCLDAVTVSYAGCPVPALDRFSLTVAPGSVVALAGPSGSGKSTVLNLLLGFTVPTQGTVRVGGASLSDVDIEAWRSRLAWVPQRPYLFAGTVAENIALGLQSTVDEIRAAARLARVEELLPVVVGSGGMGISAGQRQRVALARAFLRDAPIVLLDEPTANLDAGTEAEILDAVRRLAVGRTVLMVAHRPSLLSLADRVVELRAATVPDQPGPPALDAAGVPT